MSVSNAVTRHCVVPAWCHGGQAQFIERPLPAADDASTAPTRAWALHHLGDELTIDTMSRHAGMSPRTFIRRFRAETGQPPGTWVRELRLDHARELLERHDLSVDAIAARAGFGTAANLRHHLRRELGLSPTGYRSVFQAS